MREDLLVFRGGMLISHRVVARYVLGGVLEEYHLEGLTRGEPVVLYHGTTRTFTKFDLSYARKELVDGYYGEGIFLTPSKRVAEDYARANRNMGFDPGIVGDLKRVNPKAGAFLEALVKEGSDAWDMYTPETLGVEPGADFIGAVERAVGGVDPNTIGDVAAYVIGSKVHRLGDGEPVHIFNMSTGLPDYVYGMLDELGLDSDVYRPKVYKVQVRVRNPLVTKSQSAARGARGHGYDSVVYYGPGAVDGIPEVAVFDPGVVRILGHEVV